MTAPQVAMGNNKRHWLEHGAQEEAEHAAAKVVAARLRHSPRSRIHECICGRWE